MNKLFWFSIVIATVTASVSNAKPQQYLECAGAGVQVDIGVSEVDSATDDLLLEVDAGGSPVVYYASIAKGSVQTALESNLDFVDRDGNQGHASFVLQGKTVQLKYPGHSATVVCP